jgi:hypothetical protein
MKKALLALLLLATTLPIAGCVVVPYPGYYGYGYGYNYSYGHARPGWCYYHPYRCY